MQFSFCPRLWREVPSGIQRPKHNHIEEKNRNKTSWKHIPYRSILKVFFFEDGFRFCLIEWVKVSIDLFS